MLTNIVWGAPMGWFGSKEKKKEFKALVDPEYADLLDEIRGRFAFAKDAEAKQRDLSQDDFRFCDPNAQWPADVRGEREEEGRPCLTVDRLGPFVHQIVNEQRQNRPQPQINPTGDGASKETAEILQGMVRHIMYQSNGDTAIDTAFESMVRGGFGYVRVLTAYTDPSSFEQDIQVKRVANPFMVYMDPSFQEADASDAEWAIISSDVPMSVYKSQYPNSKAANLTSYELESVGDAAPDWALVDGSSVRVVEYFKKIRKIKKLARLEDGSTMALEDVPEGVTPEAVRDSVFERVMWFKANAVEILDQTEWPGKYIPIIPVYGTELSINGSRTWSGLIRSAKDAQRAYNYWKSAQAETIALAPRAPWIAAKGSLGNQRSLWQQANKRSIAVLEYEPFDGQDRPMPPPQRIVQEPPIMAITNAMIGAVDDLKATTGIYDPSLGNREAAQSGTAIRQLQQQGATGNFHYQDNLARMVRHLGRVLVDLVPLVYDTARVVRVVNPDDTSDLVVINEPTQDKKGLMRLYQPGMGKYDVTVSVGPAYQTRRQENLSLMTELMQGPLGAVLSQVAPDLVVSMMDFQIAPKLMDRMKKILPPELQDEKQGDIPAQVQQQMQQAQQMIEQLTGALNEAKAENASKMAEIEATNQAKMAIAQLQSETERAKLETQAAIEMAKIQAASDGLAAELTLKAQIADLDAQQKSIEHLSASIDDERKDERHMEHDARMKEKTQESPKGDDGMKEMMAGHQATMLEMTNALKRLGGKKKLIHDANGKPIGVEPDEETV